MSDSDREANRDGVQAPRLQRRSLLGGLVLLVGLGAAGLAVAVVGRGGLATFVSTPFPDPGWLLIAVGLAGADVLFSAWRLHVLSRPLERSVRFRDCVRAHLGNMCLAGLTPSQTGGGAAQLWVLVRSGLSVADGIAIATLCFLATALVLVVAGVVSLTLLSDSLPPWLEGSTLATAGILALTVVAGGVLLVRGGENAAASLPSPPDAARIGRLRRQLRVRRWGRRLREVTDRAVHTARYLPRREPGAVAAVLPITLAVFAAKIGYTFAIFRSYEATGHLDQMLGALVILVLALFFAPTPGAGGIAEAASTAYLVGVLGPTKSIGFVLWWRVLSLHIPVAIGGLVLLRQLAGEVRRPGPGEARPSAAP